jgi:hypothetical protein
MVAGTGRTTENERWPKMENDGGRRWRTTVTSRAWWSTVGRKWVDGEREGKFGGKLGEQKSENGVLQWFCFQILKFLIFFFNFFEKKKMLKLKWPFPRRKGPGKGRQDGPCLSLFFPKCLQFSGFGQGK